MVTKIALSLLQNSDKKIRVGDFRYKKLGRVGKPTAHLFFIIAKLYKEPDVEKKYRNLGT